MAVEAGQTAYIPRVPADSVVDNEGNLNLAKWVKEELDRVSEAIASLEGHYDVRHMPPPRYFPGLVVYADGTDWNPGSGEGLYVYKSTGWTFIA